MDEHYTIVVHDCNTGFVAVWNKINFTAEEFGQWMLEELQAANKHAQIEGFVPCTHVSLVALTNDELQQMEIEELICHGQMAGI